jgi:hypothetical protein
MALLFIYLFTYLSTQGIKPAVIISLCPKLLLVFLHFISSSLHQVSKIHYAYSYADLHVLCVPGHLLIEVRKLNNHDNESILNKESAK